MPKLLSANIARLWKDKAFWLFAGFMMVLALYIMVSEGLASPSSGPGTFDMLYFGYSQILGFCCAVFASLFLGTEYSDGTMRNKVVAGHSRAGIYLANLATVYIAALLMMAAWLAGGLVGIPFFGPWVNPSGCLINFIASLFTTAAFAAVFTLVAMLCTNKAVSAITSILLFMALVSLAGNIGSDAVRSFLPTGQAVWVVGDGGGSPLTLLGAVGITLFGSALITATVTVTGILLFEKKDLK